MPSLKWQREPVAGHAMPMGIRKRIWVAEVGTQRTQKVGHGYSGSEKHAEHGSERIEVSHYSIFRTILISHCRNKVDLTKYIEEHNFNFDNVFDQEANNDEVRLMK